ncbi:MAG: ketosteroid isomerase family protein [Chloroflexi bacterium]|nr:ketosteroid isomerase family protein [Chloroflexota bacterium]
MSDKSNRESAVNPEDLARFFIARANAGDAEGLAALYEAEAVLIGPDGQQIVGIEAIRNFYAGLLKRVTRFQGGEQRPALRNGNIALTSSRLVNGRVTAEVARRQPDGSWLWIIDQPGIA